MHFYLNSNTVLLFCIYDNVRPIYDIGTPELFV
jgi:hypothetical protein